MRQRVGSKRSTGRAVSKPVARSSNVAAVGDLPMVLLPWNLGSYEPMNNFHPVLRKWVETQTGVRFVRPPWARELNQSPRWKEDSRSDHALDRGWGRIFQFKKAREFFSVQEFDFSSRLSAAAEFHHTVPFTTAERPFFFHCEAIPPIFMPMVFQGQQFDREVLSNILPIYREIFESDQCLGIFSHLQSTIAEFTATFQSDKIRQKLRYLPLAADMYVGTARSDEPPIFIFNNSAHQDPNSLVRRGGIFAIQILDIVRCERPDAKLLFVGSHAQRLFSEPSGLGAPLLNDGSVRELLDRNRDNIIWVNRWLPERTFDRLLASAHFFLLPSIDLHSSSILRAMSHGCIPIVSNAYGIPELISHDRNGIVLNILDSSLSGTTEFGFTNTNHDLFINQFHKLRDRVSREIRENLDTLVEPSLRLRLFQQMVKEFERRFGGPVDTKIIAEPLREASSRLATSGDVRGFTFDVSPEDFNRVARLELARIGNQRIIRYGPNVLSFREGEIADRRATSLEWFLNSKPKLVRCWPSPSKALAALADADIPHSSTRTSPFFRFEEAKQSIGKAEIRLQNGLSERVNAIEETIEEQERWSFALEASMAELRSRLRSLETWLVGTIEQRLSSFESTIEERTIRLATMEHQSEARIQQTQRMDAAIEDLRKAVESALYTIAMLGIGLDGLEEQLLKKRLSMLEAAHLLAKSM